MKLYTPLLLAALSLAGAACSGDDDLLTLPEGTVGETQTYTDPRDGHTYRYVRIGDQEWLTENLAYLLPGGASEGCFTWQQNTFKADAITLDPETFCQLYLEVCALDTHDWKAEIGILPVVLQSYLQFYQNGMYTQERFVSMFDTERWGAFHVVLVEAMNVKRAEMLTDYAREQCEAAELKNNHYSQTYGLLYSLAAARAAAEGFDGGWRLPTEQDWQRLETTLGMPQSELAEVNAWRGEGCGLLLQTDGGAKWNARMGGCNAWSGSGQQWIKQQECAYYWVDEQHTVTKEVESEDPDAAEGEMTQISVEEGSVRQLAIYSTRIWRGTTRLTNPTRDVLYSVRLVRDANH